MKSDDVVDDNVWAVVTKAFNAAERREPDRSRVSIVFAKIADVEAGIMPWEAL